MSGSFYSGGLTSPVGVADGGTGGTTQATARTGLGLGSASVEALTTDGTTTTGALGAADRRVLIPAHIPSGKALPPTPINGSMTTQLLTALRIYYIPIEFFRQDDFASVQCEVTTLSAGNAKMGLYAPDSSGYPAAKVWDSGSFSVGSTGVKNVTFAAGTWSDTSYQNGANFRAKGYSELMFLAIQTDTGVAPTLRAFPAAGRRLLWIDPAMGASPNVVEYIANSGSFGLPASASSLSNNANTAGIGVVPVKA